MQLIAGGVARPRYVLYNMIEQFLHFLHSIHDVRSIIQWGGLFMICVIVFVETGLFFGFFLPGDSLLVTAGIFAAMGQLHLESLLFFVALCAVAGDQLGFYIGHKTGELLFTKKDSRFFKQEHLQRTKLFYEKYGPKTIVLARFVPIVRTFAPAVAGVASMNYKKFVVYNVFGGILWVMVTVLGGFFVGSIIPNIESYLHIVIAIVIALSFVPIIIEVLKDQNSKKKLQSSPVK